MAEARDPYRQLVDNLWNDGKLGADVRRAAKQLFPDLNLPDDQVAPIIAPLRAELDETRRALTEMREEREKERKEREDSRTRQSLEQALEGARTKYGLTEDGFNKMVDRMRSTGNYGDAEAAAAWVAQQTPAPAPPRPTWMAQSYDMRDKMAFEKDRFDLLHKNPDQYLDAELVDFFADPDGYTAKYGQVPA